jgi:hypothetical protein
MYRRNTYRFLLTLFWIGLFVASCEKDRNPVLNPGANDSNSQRLIIGNEGSFGTNTASVSIINLDKNTVANKVYKSANGQDLGDVLQSVTKINSCYYLVINNSNKIIVVDSNFNHIKSITSLQSPRYILKVSESQAYVSSIFNNKMYVIDLLTHTKIHEMQMDFNWTEQMVLHADVTGEYVFVCEKDTAVNYITKIQIATNTVIDKVPISGYSPSQISKTTDGHLWVLGGNYYDKIGTLTEINPIDNSIVATFVFPQKFTTGQLAIGPNDEKYVTVVDYSTNNHRVYKFEKGATDFPHNFFTNQPSNANFYGIQVDQSTADVFISDTKGFTQSGDVNRYSSQGVLLNSWTVGVGPSSFYFVD